MSATPLKKSFAVVLFGGGASKGFLLATEFLLAGMLGAEFFGYFALGFAFLVVAANVSLYGFQYAVVQYISVYTAGGDNDRIRGLIQSVLIVAIAVAASVGAAVSLGADVLAVRVFGKPELVPVLKIVGLVIPLEALNQLLAAVFRGFRRFRAHVLASDFVRNLILLVSLPGLVMLDASPEMAISVLAVATAAGTVYGVWAVRAYLWPLQIQLWRETLGAATSFSTPLFAWNVLQQVAGHGQMFIAGVFLAPSQIGIFGVFLRVGIVFKFLQGIVNHVLPVEFAELWHSRQRDNLDHLFGVSAAGLMILSGAIAVLFLTAPTFIMGLVGDAYSAHALLLIPIVAAQLYNVGTGPAGQLLIASHQQRALLVVALLGATLQIVLGVTLIPTLALTGAVLAEAFTAAGSTTARQVFAKVRLGVHVLDRETASIAGLVALAAASGWAVSSLTIGSSPLLAFASGALVGMGVYAVSIAILVHYFPTRIPRAHAFASRLMGRRIN